MQPEPIIYVVDDDDAVRQSLDFLLRTAGFTVRTFESGKVFIESMPSLKSGCIITDVRMPEISGIDLLRRVKAQDADVPVIMITGISPRTVEIYRANLMTKMAATSLSDLVRMAMMAGILENSPRKR